MNLIEDELQESSYKRRRGRPRKYSESFILLVFFIKVMRKYSFRDTVFYFEEILGVKVPSISTLHYRFSKLDMLYFKKLFDRVLEKLKVDEELELMVVDGTRFGYDDKQRLNWMRGRKIREVSSHVRVEIIVGRKEKGGKPIVVGVSMGPAYSDERKLLLGLMGSGWVRAQCVIGDGIYSMSLELLEKFFERSDLVLVPVKDTLRTKVKHPLRQKAKQMYEANREKYRERYIVEQVIGKIKNAYGGCESTKSFEMAMKSIWAKVILYN
ncbi:MAG TPA: transposase [Pseudothermotoga sp.]